MTSPDPETSPRRAARAEAERRATAAITLPDVPPSAPVSRSVEPPAEAASRTAPSPGPTRRELRTAAASGPDVFVRRRIAVMGGVLAVVVAAATVAAATIFGSPSDATGEALRAVDAPVALAQAVPGVPSEGLPVPSVAAAPASATPCDDPAFTDALAAGDDTSAIAAAGGGEAFRGAVVAGLAPCVSLSDPTRAWVVVNKQRPYDPVDWRPGDLTMPEGVRALEQSALRAPAAQALTAMVAAARDAGAGEIGFLSAFRSYTTQQSTYAGRVAVRGVAEADLESARPGFSEHQSGLAVDIVPCSNGCGTLDDVAASPQGAWVREHAWEFGYVTRYVEGRTDVTGYEPEAWHLRYIGPELARAYHEGGYTTLEEFFGLPAAPSY